MAAFRARPGDSALSRMMLCLLALLSSPFATDQNASSSEAPLVSAEGTPSWVYPQRREADGYSILIHAPQVRSWPEFARMEAQAAVERERMLAEAKGKERAARAVASLQGVTTVTALHLREVAPSALRHRLRRPGHAGHGWRRRR